GLRRARPRSTCTPGADGAPRPAGAGRRDGGHRTRTCTGLRPAVFKTAALPVRSSPPNTTRAEGQAPRGPRAWPRFAHSLAHRFERPRRCACKLARPRQFVPRSSILGEWRMRLALQVLSVALLADVLWWRASQQPPPT